MIRWRGRLRNENCADQRPLALVGIIVSFIFVWLFGLVILSYFWWRSMPAHYEWMTLGIGALLIFAFLVAFRSFGAALQNLRAPEDRKPARVWRGVARLFFILLFGAISSLSWLRTEGGIDEYVIMWDDYWRIGNIAIDREQEYQTKRQRHKDLRAKYGFESFLARAELSETDLTQLPKDWQPRDHAEKWFRADWCKREGIPTRLQSKDPDTEESTFTFPCKNLTVDQAKTFAEEWQTRRTTYLNNLSRPNLARRDLRDANLFQAFLPRVDLRSSRLVP